MRIKDIKTSAIIEYEIIDDKTEYGSTCKCYHAICDKRICLIKEFVNYSDAENDARLLNERITNIQKMYHKKGLNYFLEDYFIGSSLEEPIKYYQVFRYHEGETLVSNHSTKYSRENFKLIIDQYHNFLCGLQVFHDNQTLHMDIKPSNIFSLSGNDKNKRSLQLIDFGSLNSIEDVKSNFEDGDYRTRLSSRPWYTESDENKLINILDDIYFEDDNILKVMDCTAAARILAFMLYGHDALPPNKEELKHYLEQLPHEGIRLALEHFFAKAFADDLIARYLDVRDMIEDIEVIMDSFEERPRSVIAWKIKNAISHFDIDSAILPCVREEETPFYENDGDLGSFEQLTEDSVSNKSKAPLEQLLGEHPTDNIFIVGDGGFGKTTSLKYEYFKNLCAFHNHELFLYYPLKKYQVYQKEDILSFVAKENEIALNLLTTTRVTVLLDAYDEIPARRNAPIEEREKFDTNFFKQLVDLHQQNKIRFVITSRFIPEKKQCISSVQLPDQFDFRSVKYQPLSEDQIVEFLKKDRIDYQSIQEKKPLINLLTNPMMLTIFCKLRNMDHSIINVTNETQLLDEYFWNLYAEKNSGTLYMGKNGKLSKPDDFSCMIEALSCGAIHKKNECNRIYDASIACFQAIIDVAKKSNEKYTVSFKHELFKEYFQAKYIQLVCQKIRKHSKVTKKDLKFLKADYSYVALLFAGQMLAEPVDQDALQEQQSSTYGQVFEGEPVGLKALQNICCYISEKNDTIDQDILTNLFRIITFFRLYNDWEFNYDRCFTSIEDGAFYDCPHVTEVTIPHSIVKIGGGTFLNCQKLTKLYYSGTIAEWNRIEYPIHHLCKFDVYCADGKIPYHDDISQHEFETVCMKILDKVIIQSDTKETAIANSKELRYGLPNSKEYCDGFTECGSLGLKMLNKVVLEFHLCSNKEFVILKFFEDKDFQSVCIRKLKDFIFHPNLYDQITTGYSNLFDKVISEIKLENAEIFLNDFYNEETIRNALIEALSICPYTYILELISKQISNMESVILEFKTNEPFRTFCIQKIKPFIKDSNSNNQALQKIKSKSDEYFSNELFNEEITRAILIVILGYYPRDILLKLIG